MVEWDPTAGGGRGRDDEDPQGPGDEAPDAPPGDEPDWRPVPSPGVPQSPGDDIGPDSSPTPDQHEAPYEGPEDIL